MEMVNNFVVKTETRPCWVNGRRAIWHRWTDSARPVKPWGQEDDEDAKRFQTWNVHGLVEYEDGTVARVWPHTVQFVPDPLLEYLVKTYSNPGDTVLDNCMGSGSTGVACVRTGRRFIGMEQDPQYFQVAKERIESERAAQTATEPENQDATTEPCPVAGPE